MRLVGCQILLTNRIFWKVKRLIQAITFRWCGWLSIYLVGSAPVTLFYAAGLSGRFFDYHWGAVAGIFFVLAAPLMLVVLRVRSAPAWNIAALWVGAGSISMILLAGALTADQARLIEVAATAVIIVFASTGWAAVWTMYFLRSDRVATTFTRRTMNPMRLRGQ